MPEQWFLAAQGGLPDLQSALGDPRLRWAYAERMEDTVLVWLRDLLAGPVALERWACGRAFGPQLEVSWQREGAGYNLRACAVEGGAPPGSQWQPDPAAAGWVRSKKDEELLLFGEQESETQTRWSALRIPRYLDYPVDQPGPRVALVVAVYQAQGQRRLQRFVGLAGVKIDE